MFFLNLSVFLPKSDGDATNSSKDLLHEIGGPMSRSKIMSMNQALQSLIIKIKVKEGRYSSEAEPTWLNFLQLDEEALSPTLTSIHMIRIINGLVCGLIILN
jgi:hypothetical protein